MKKKEPTIAIGRSSIELLMFLVEEGKQKGFDYSIFMDGKSIADNLEGLAQSLGQSFFKTHALMTHHLKGVQS